SVQARNADFDYPAVAALADGVIVMNYDEHYPGAAPGPVASQDWFVLNLTAIKKVVPQEKLICAIGNYGYDWVQRPKRVTLPPDRMSIWRAMGKFCGSKLGPPTEHARSP